MIRPIKDNIFYTGVQDWDRRLFDELIPLPEGTSYNSYLVKGGHKTALIDTADPARFADLLQNIRATGVKSIDYIVANHAEQDHSGSIPLLLKEYPQAKVVTNPKCRDFLADHGLITPEQAIAKNEGETLDLGGRTLEFILAPWVHWPETQFTWLKEDRVLFTCDFLGSHLATSKLYSEKDEVMHGAKRYYAEIMSPFRSSQPKYLDRIAQLDPELICPSHGPVHRKPFFIVDAYREWSSEKVKNEVLLPWVSMHGSTEAMVRHLTGALVGRGITVKPYQLTRSDLGEIASGLLDAATVVLGTSTALVGPHPQGLYAAAVVGALRPKTKFISVIGSYGWGSKAVETVQSLLANVKAELIPPVYVKGYPSDADFLALDKMADTILEKHKSLGLV
ncbi:MAG TPA: FprA family A-type flavoprotein [Candidatus Edwardsbacteria bacterium]|nr:FprA family A-type flavoprotein [Candidatus Edwardsbacteria bacterium]